MPYNAKTDSNAGYISKKHKARLIEMATHQKRGQRAQLEWLIDQEYERLGVEYQEKLDKEVRPHA